MNHKTTNERGEYYVIYKHIANISKQNNGWTKEINLVSWNNREPVYDLRSWNKEHTKMGKGITLTANDMLLLKEALNKMDIF